MSHPQELHIEISRGNIAALAWGPRTAPAIIAVHGWLDNAASFIPIAEYFKDFRFIAIDLLGHGHSTHAPHGEYLHYIDYVVDLAAILDRLELETASILGHSLGAGISAILSGTLRDRVRALGLIDSIAPITMQANQMPDLLQKAVHDYARLTHKKLPIYANLNEAVAARLAASAMESSSVELLVERGTKPYHNGYTWRTDPRLMCGSLFMYTEEQIAPFLARIQCNACLIRPSHGGAFDEKIFSQRIKNLRNVEVHKVNGQHHVHMDSPQIVGTILNDFFLRNL